MSLARVQREFLDAVLGEAAPRDAGMAVYHSNALAVRREAIAAAHPVTRRLVGDAFLAEAAERFARAFPSATGDLHGYGAGFSGFIAGYAPARALPYLPDVARLEWAVHESSLAADGTPLDHAALGAVAADVLPRLRMRLHPAARLVESAHPILAIWEANQPGRDGTPDRESGPDRVLVRREGLAVVPVLADAAAWTLLTAFERGLTLAEACAGLEDADHDFAPALARVAAMGALGGHEVAAPP